ncbi:protein translocase subunit SecF [Thermocrinis minervae]|uniref:Protein-export membrane protein SecF n=1 Tax=Thermocrinis minervae TaxID=381751 RepID=A0A1M6QUL8_9AQUI|nr:protein translocase subunit SecF [Thermocrinis minervae]SHK23951.1 preprotein translocase subunit SecF [Thermocrinis minervae]
MKFRFYSYAVSLTLLIISLVFLQVRGLNLGIDFTGGTILEVAYKAKVSTEQVRQALQKEGLNPHIQNTASGSFLIRLKLGEDPQRALTSLKSLGDYSLIRQDTIGSVISSELRSKAIWSVLVALGGITVYLTYRYKLLWAFAGLVALFHDVIIVLGAYAITQREVNLDVIASLLVVAGYSVTDTVVIYDRMRENLRIRKSLPLRDLINISVNQNLARTLMTSMTVFVVALAMFLFGGSALSNVMFAFVVGVVVGTLSSIFVASSLILDITRFKFFRGR